MAISDSGKPPRRRRTPEAARQEIIGAARDLLAEVPVHEVTVAALMARTTLSRKSFYVYFRDRAELFAELVQPLRADADATLRQWRESDDTIGAGRAALASAAAVYHRHGTLLRALFDASGSDREAAQAWASFIDPVIEVAAEKIKRATSEGTSSGLTPLPTARALVGMNVAYFFSELVAKPNADVPAVVDTLATIWERTFYSRP